MAGRADHRILADRRGGFNLMFLSILMTVGSIWMVASLPNTRNDLQKASDTTQTLNKVESRLTGFMALNGRLPCPADGQYGVNTANFGIEAATPGTCTGGTPAAPLGPDAGTNYVVGGVIPTKSLHLDDSYAFDEWGRRITYVVDKRATKKGTDANSCSGLENFPTNNGTGGIKIESSTGGTVLDNVMHAFIVHGPDGHGAFPEQGSTVANRINTGTIDTDKLTNAGVDSSFTYNTANFTNVKVMKDRTATFGDLVYYAQYQKNTCCVGGATNCTSVGFRVDGSVANGMLGSSIATGDVNGDGIQDLIIGAAVENVVYVIFGTTSGFPNPLPSSGTLASWLNGSNGFSLTGALPYSLAAGDIDHDGYDDIIVGGNGQNYAFYGHAAPFNASYDLISSLTACQGFNIQGTIFGGLGFAVAAGDVDGDGIADMVMSDTSVSGNKGKVYVIFGRASAKTCPGTGSVNGAATSINPDNLTNATTPRGSIINGPSATGGFGNFVAVGDIDNSGKNDVIIGDPRYASNKGRVYAVFGQASWANTVAAGSLKTNASPYGFIINDSTASQYFGDSGAAGDVTGDSITDLLVGSNDGGGRGGGYAWVVKGMSNAAWQAYHPGSDPVGGPFTLSKMVTAGDAFQFQNAEYLGNVPAIADVNHDGIGDLIIGDPDWGGVHSANGSTYVLFGPISAGRNLDSSPPTGGTDGTRIDCPYPDNLSCGKSLGAADVNGDGTKDVMIGVQDGSVTGSNAEGYTYVLYGKSSGWTATYDLSKIY